MGRYAVCEVMSAPLCAHFGADITGEIHQTQQWFKIDGTSFYREMVIMTCG